MTEDSRLGEEMKLLACLVVAVALPALAQQEAPEQAAPVKAAVAAAQVTLESGLAQLDWDAARRGPLLLIAPNKLTLSSKTPLPPPRNGYGLPELVGYFEQQVVRFPTLTTAGPTQIPELRVPIQESSSQGEFFGQRQPYALLTSLTPEQLKRACRPEGLGYSELTSERQRALWQKMLPTILRFRGSSTLPAGLSAGQSPWHKKTSLPVLSPMAQKNLHLRLQSSLWLYFQPSSFGLSDRADRAQPEVEVALKTLPAAPDQLEEYDRQQRVARAVPSKVPYRRKPTELDLSLERFSVPLSLVGVKTIGELTQRAAQALKLELYADARLAGLPVFYVATLEQRVSASDALNAILRATATTIRRIQVGQSVAFVITFDRVPLGNQGVALFDQTMLSQLDLMEEQMSEGKMTALAYSKLREAKILTLAPRVAGWELPEKLWELGVAHRETTVPLAELPATIQQRAKDQWVSVQKERSRPEIQKYYQEPHFQQPPVSARAVVNIDVSFVYPGLGEAGFTSLDANELMPKPEPPLVELDNTLKTRGVRVLPPKTAGEAQQLLKMVKERNFTALYVALSGDANDDRGVELLSAEKAGLPLIPTLSPLMPAPTDAARERDISVTGRTAVEMAQGRPVLSAIVQLAPFIQPLFQQITRLDALTPEAVPIERLAARLARLATLPGVEGIGLHDRAALGYLPEQMESLWAGGYSPIERLMFLRAQGSDPADLVNRETSAEFNKLLFYQETEQEGRLRNAWDTRRKERVAQLSKRLESAFAAVRLTKPLWELSGGSLFSSTHSNWKPWRGGAGPTNLPFWEVQAEGVGSGRRDADIAGWDELNKGRLWLTRQLWRAGKEASEDTPAGISTAGFVLDLSDLPLSEALKVLEGVIAPKKSTSASLP